MAAVAHVGGDTMLHSKSDGDRQIRKESNTSKRQYHRVMTHIITRPNYRPYEDRGPRSTKKKSPTQRLKCLLEPAPARTHHNRLFLVAIATTATTAATAEATLTRLACLGEVDVHCPAADLRLVHGRNGFLSGLLITEGDKAKSPAPASLAVLDNIGFCDGSELRECLAQILRIHRPRKPTNEKLGFLSLLHRDSRSRNLRARN